MEEEPRRSRVRKLKAARPPPGEPPAGPEPGPAGRPPKGASPAPEVQPAPLPESPEEAGPPPGEAPGPEEPATEAPGPDLSPTLAEGLDLEVQALRKDLAAKIFELEMEKVRIVDMGRTLAMRSEELDRTSSSAREKEAQLTTRLEALDERERDLQAKSELVTASSDAISSLDEEVRERSAKLKEAEAEARKLSSELEIREQELRKQQEGLAAERAALEEQKVNLDKLLSEVQAREETVSRTETDAEKGHEELQKLRRDAEELDARLKGWSEKLKRKEEEVKAFEQHLLSIEEEISLCPHCGAAEEFAILNRRTEALSAKGEDVEELRSAVREARKALKAGDYDRSAEHARRASELLRSKETEGRRREVSSKIVAAESLNRLLRESKADVSQLEALTSGAWTEFKANQLARAEEMAEKARLAGIQMERDRFQAMDEMVAAGAYLTALKRSGVNVLQPEERKKEAEAAMGAGDFRRARMLASETIALASEAAQSTDISTAMSQIKLSEETLEELRGLGFDVTEWERTLNRSRDFLKKLDFKSAEETARWVRQKAKESGRLYKQALLAMDHVSSVLTTFKDTGVMVKRAEELQEEAKAKMQQGDTEVALNLAKKSERMAREIAERQKGAVIALRKAALAMRGEKRAGADISRSEKLHDLAQHQMEMGEYANAMKLALKAFEALNPPGTTILELCPVCGEAIPEGSPECPKCAERKKRAEEAAPEPEGRELPAEPASDADTRRKVPETLPEPKEPRPEDVSKTKLGVKGGRKYACPYCGELFDIKAAQRPITVTCPWCSNDVSVVD